MVDEDKARWKVKVVVFVNGTHVNTYYQPDIPQVRIEAIERMVNMGRLFNVEDNLDLKEFGDEPAHMFYQGTLNGDTVRREMTVVIV